MQILNDHYIPRRPFENYKWFFATKAPTESLGDPVVLLGLINRIAPLATQGIFNYSSDEFAKIMKEMHRDTITTVNLEERVGPRNLMRNSAQYWKLFGLIPLDVRGKITITEFAKDIIEGKISQIDFASAIIVSLTLPNRVSYSERDISDWKNHELIIKPFKLILQIMRALFKINSLNGWITNEELYSIIIPMAGEKIQPKHIANYILKFRENPKIIQGWYNAVPRANDKRYSAEFLRFLANFGFIEKNQEIYNLAENKRDTIKFYYINELDEQISILIDGNWTNQRVDLIKLVKKLDLETTIRQTATLRSNSRPKQQKFRRALIEHMGKCAVTGNSLTTVLQAAHIKPYAYGGSDELSNGLLLRADIHILFDAGLLNLRPDPFYKNRCFIELNKQSNVQINYPTFSNELTIQLPQFTNMENIEWRYENRLMGVVE